VYVYRVRSERDVQDRRGRTDVAFDADTGELRLFSLATGQHSGNTLTNWLYALHMGNVLGLPYRIFVCVLGLAVTSLIATGVIVWFGKRNVMRRARARHALPTKVASNAENRASASAFQPQRRSP